MLMKSVIKKIFLLSLFLCFNTQAQSPMREQALKKAAQDSLVIPLNSIQLKTDSKKVSIGKKIFESTLLSFNGKTSCQTCHLDKFSSADGLANAVGTGGMGEGHTRMMSGGDIVPRNTLPLWGRGSKGFNTFFWDGKVQVNKSNLISQFGTVYPSSDPLIVAVHLPFVEIREMVVRDENVARTYETEKTNAADKIYQILSDRLKNDIALSEELANATSKSVDEITFFDIAESVAHFIRKNFAVEKTKFDDFMYNGGELTESELRGGLTFFGKGQCSSCHNGPLMSDLEFHVMPFKQIGFGKNGFGVDYGRFNVTLKEADTYKFRTPPLINVTKTSPYSHSGSYKNLYSVIKAHTDPLKDFDGTNYNVIQRREFITKLTKWGGSYSPSEPLSDNEIKNIIAFLHTLETIK